MAGSRARPRRPSLPAAAPGPSGFPGAARPGFQARRPVRASRVWAARGLLYAWDDRATAAIIRATADGAWRVREMAAKVIARHRVGDAFAAVAELRSDQVPRVRAAAERAVVVRTASGT